MSCPDTISTVTHLSAVVTGARGFDPDYVDITWTGDS
jgi:hypothetical protein